MVVGRNNGVGFSEKKMSGLLFGPKKSGRNNAVVVLTGWSYGGVPLYYTTKFPTPNLNSSTHELPLKTLTKMYKVQGLSNGS